MKLAIMQPYFIPYLGYWQLINSVDIFVIYDNIEFTKNGYIRKNNYLLNGQSKTFSLPLQTNGNNNDDLKENVTHIIAGMGIEETCKKLQNKPKKILSC